VKDKTGQTVAEVAELLGISRDAVRKRISRGTLRADKPDGETWTIYLDNDQPTRQTTQTEQDTAHYWELINGQQEEIARLRAELERERARVDQLIERIPPQLPAPAPRKNLLERIFNRNREG